jgi:hypothetical protein
VSRRLVNITLDNIDDLPARCRSCLFWELDRETPDGGPRHERRHKESWISGVLLGWGSCGKIVYVDGVPAGYVMYAPPAHVPRSATFPTSPVSDDAVLLMTGAVLAEFAGGGLGRMLIQGAARDLMKRKVRAVEAFGAHRRYSPSCVLPVGYLLAVGFTTVCEHRDYPRLRLDLRTVVSWRDDVGAAIEKLLGVIAPPPPPPDPAPYPA